MRAPLQVTNGALSTTCMRYHGVCSNKYAVAYEPWRAQSSALRQVSFHPLDATRLFSGSEDGLVQLSSVAGALDEDEGFLVRCQARMRQAKQAGMLCRQCRLPCPVCGAPLAVPPAFLRRLRCGNAGTHGRQAALSTDSVARLGAYGGPRLERLWVQTHTERLYFWDWAAACDEGAEGAHAPGLGHAGDACTRNASGGVLQLMRAQLLIIFQSCLVRATAHHVQMRMVHEMRFTRRNRGGLLTG